MMLLPLVVMAALASLGQGQKTICYYTNWSQYRPDPLQYFPENIDPFLCTHIMFSFATMEGNRLIPYEWNDDDTDWSDGMYTRTIKLKEENPDLKVLLAVGGWNFGVAKMTAMLATPENRAEFVSTSITYLRDRGFDGLDLDFEYPGATRDDLSPPEVSPPEDKQRFTALVQELRQAFDAEGADTGREPLMLTAAVGCGKDKIDGGYEIDLLSPNLDWIGLMSYDFNGAWDNITGHNSPLYASGDSSAPEGYEIRSIDWCVNYWEAGGATRDKLVVGLATYGRGFTLTDPRDFGLYAPASGAANSGQFTREAGFLASYEICETLEQAGGQVTYDPVYSTPYVVLGDQWVSFDNPQSINEKMTYVVDNSYAGVMTWCLDLDDFEVTYPGCQAGHYPLINIMKCRQEGLSEAQCIGSGSTTTSTTSTPPTSETTVSTTTESTTQSSTTLSTTTLSTTTLSTTTSSTQSPSSTTQSPPPVFTCDGKPAGNYPDPEDCTRFITCEAGGAMIPVQCAPGLYYNTNNGICDWPYNLTPERQEECGL